MMVLSLHAIWNMVRPHIHKATDVIVETLCNLDAGI